MDNEAIADGILPCQYFTRRTNDPFLAERRLWCAAFESHLKDCQLYLPKGKPLTNPTKERRQRDALEWLADDGDAPLTFRWYCAALSLDADAVRARLAKGPLVLKRASPVTSDFALKMREYHRQYREKHRDRLRTYNTEYCRARREGVR